MTLLSGAGVAWPVRTRAQQRERMPVIGFLHPASPDGNPERIRAFREGLRETGFIEGENVAIEYRWAENQLDRLPTLADELVDRRVSVLVAPARPPGGIRGQGGNQDKPDCFHRRRRSGQAWSRRQPQPAEWHLTGINFLNVELAAKRLGLLREFLPGATRIALRRRRLSASENICSFRVLFGCGPTADNRMVIMRAIKRVTAISHVGN
jgi:putative tryptophan/tyrosine transport system substrate-binding protein